MSGDWVGADACVGVWALQSSTVTEWGNISLCDAEKRLLANALLDLSNEWFILLSETCIPLYNFSIIYTYLKGSNHSFVESFDDPSPHARGRYNPEMAPLIDISQWRKGSQWFEVDRTVATHMVQDTMYYLAFKVFCKPPCYVDEHYFPTLLHIKTSSLIANRTITLTDWSRGGSHPATFGEADISEEFFKRILDGQDCLYNGQNSSICVLFARKFAPSALQPLLHLASTVLGFT
ncbi:glycosyltransferase BC10-like [Dendrobium catenatum]|uniref:glycosyltransferase BC10-like n=1 Tax=Dendrobium catenatum TaxID=906689 RepID=UPI00109FBCB5|nr:glycosyltransferase BC10-like [Dendrobium catenatum]